MEAGPNSNLRQSPGDSHNEIKAGFIMLKSVSASHNRFHRVSLVFLVEAFVLVALSAQNVFADTVVTEDFDSGFSGWSQSSDYSADATGGVSGSGGVDFSTTAVPNRGALHPIGIEGSGAGHTITLITEVRISINGTLIDDVTGSNENGINQPFFGLRLSTTPEWFSGTNANIYLTRRNNGFWGVRTPSSPFVEGFEQNQQLGFADNSGSAGTSEFFELELTLTENSGFYDQQLRVYKPNGTLAFETLVYPSLVPTGSTLYGGWNNGFGSFNSNTMEEISKVNRISIDNFTVIAVPEPSAFVSIVAGGLFFSMLSAHRVHRCRVVA